MKKRISPALALAAFALAMAACSGNQQSSTSSSSDATVKPLATVAAMKAAANGAAVYNANCSSCHQSNGKGQAGAFPPLAGNAVVTGPAGTVIHILKHGLNGTIKVGAQTYNGQMPAWGGTLKDGEIAAVISYIRSSWGNHASAVTEKQVAAAK